MFSIKGKEYYVRETSHGTWKLDTKDCRADLFEDLGIPCGHEFVEAIVGYPSDNRVFPEVRTKEDLYKVIVCLKNLVPIDVGDLVKLVQKLPKLELYPEQKVIFETEIPVVKSQREVWDIDTNPIWYEIEEDFLAAWIQLREEKESIVTKRYQENDTSPLSTNEFEELKREAITDEMRKMLDELPKVAILGDKHYSIEGYSFEDEDIYSDMGIEDEKLFLEDILGKREQYETFESLEDLQRVVWALFERVNILELNEILEMIHSGKPITKEQDDQVFSQHIIAITRRQVNRWKKILPVKYHYLLDPSYSLKIDDLKEWVSLNKKSIKASTLLGHMVAEEVTETWVSSEDCEKLLEDATPITARKIREWLAKFEPNCILYPYQLREWLLMNLDSVIGMHLARTSIIQDKQDIELTEYEKNQFLQEAVTEEQRAWCEENLF